MFDPLLGARALRRSGGLLAALLVASSAPLLVDCSSPDGSPAGGDGGAGSDAPIVVPPAPLRFTYDEGDKRIRVHVLPKTDDLTAVVVRLRKGTLSIASLDKIDCDEIGRTGARVALRGGTKEETGDLSYAGPTVNDAFLDQFYEREVIGPDATDAQLAAIQAGTDPIVEGCLVREGQALAKAQVSVFRAWDDATPDLLDRLQALEKGGPDDESAVMHGVASYGALCERELGEIPFFPRQRDGSYATYSCTTGAQSVTIPITVTDNGGNATEQTSEPQRCDRPDWLRRSCAPFARVQRAVNSKGSHWVLLCRKMKPGQKKDDTTFNDLALIGHNPVTGKACYFQNGLYGKTDGARVASPADPRLGETTWSSFNVSTCNGCHDNDPWAHSPWIDQAKNADGSYVVPRIGSDKAYPMNNAAPFALVGMRSKGWQMRPHLVSPEARACTTCHRIAQGNTITGEETGASWTERSVGADQGFFSQRVTPAFQSFANSHWMPPSLAGLTESGFRSSDFGKAVTFINGCKTSKTCKYEPIPTK